AWSIADGVPSGSVLAWSSMPRLNAATRRAFHGHPADPLCWRREAAALYDAGPHAVHNADDVVFLCDFHLQRTVLGSTAWCLRADLGRACALYLVDAGRASPGPGEGLIFTIR